MKTLYFNNKLRNVYAAFIIVFAIMLTVPFWINSLRPSLGKDFNWKVAGELYKILFNFVSIGFLGGVVVQEYNRSKQKRIDRVNFRKQAHKILTDTYLELKRIRWNLRFTCHDKMISPAIYREEIKKISEIKTRLEVISNDININSKAVWKVEEVLYERLEKMEDYLRDILNEFCKLSHQELAIDHLSLESLPKLASFVEINPEYQTSDFTLNFRKHYKEALDALINDEKRMQEDFV
jgi:hypothetical protein